MKNQMRKKYQILFNKKIHALNKATIEDSLWRGRFVFLQRDARWYEFPDHSGGILTVFVRCYDKKTGYYKDYRLEYAPWLKTFNWKLTMDIANTFIVDDLDVWAEDPSPREQKQDWTKVKVDVEDLMRKPWNFYISYKYWEGGNNIW